MWDVCVYTHSIGCSLLCAPWWAISVWDKTQPRLDGWTAEPFSHWARAMAARVIALVNADDDVFLGPTMNSPLLLYTKCVQRKAVSAVSVSLFIKQCISCWCVCVSRTKRAIKLLLFNWPNCCCRSLMGLLLAERREWEVKGIPAKRSPYCVLCGECLLILKQWSRF